MKKISICLVTWNGQKYIEKCLQHVFAQTCQDFELLIIDNGSTDETLEIINEKYPHLRILKNKENQGFAKTYNRAIHWTKSEYVLCLNQDVFLDSKYLEEIIKFLDRYPRVGSCSGKLYRFENNNTTKYIDSLGLRIKKNWQAIDLHAGEIDEGQFDGQKEVFGVSGAVPLYRRKALETVLYKNEFFDEDFFAYKEDVDLAMRLFWQGWQSYIVPTAVAYHVRSAGVSTKEKNGFKAVLKNRKRKNKFINFYSYRNKLFFAYKNLPKFSFKYFFPVLVYELSKFVYVLFLEQRSLTAWKDFFKLKKQMKEKRKFIFNNKRVDLRLLDKWLLDK